jgi:hypothetical protein
MRIKRVLDDRGNTLLPNKVKPIAGFTTNNPKNTDAEMLGKLHALTFSSTTQGIQLLLPHIQKAPENNYGESVLILQIIKYIPITYSFIRNFHHLSQKLQHGFYQR